jgi:hypothetical protein
MKSYGSQPGGFDVDSSRAWSCRPLAGYRIQTTVPEHWIPFIPVVVNPGRRDVVLERGVLLRSASEGPAAAEPAERILRPSRLAEQPYRLAEEELPRNGRRVLRVPHRSRWIDGSTRCGGHRRAIARPGAVEHPNQTSARRTLLLGRVAARVKEHGIADPGSELCTPLCAAVHSAARPIWLWDWAWACVVHPTSLDPRSFVTCGSVEVGCTPRSEVGG